MSTKEKDKQQFTKKFQPFKSMPTFKHIQYRDQMPEPKFALDQQELSNIISTSKRNFDPYFQSRNMIEDQLVKEERNKIDFYTIKDIDKVRAKKRDNTDFRSIHYITDKPIAASQNLQLFQYKDVTCQRLEERDTLNRFECETRQGMKRKYGDKKILMNEVYEQLGEMGLQKPEKGKINSQQQQDRQMMQDLDQWSNDNTAFYKHPKIAHFQHFKRNRVTQMQDSKSNLVDTVSKARKSILGLLTRNKSNSGNSVPPKSVTNIQDSIKEEKERERDSINPTNPNSFFPALRLMQKRQTKIQNPELNSSNEKSPRKGAAGGVGQGQGGRKTFKEAFQNVKSLIKQRKGVELVGESDRDIKKKLNSYLNAIPDGENENPSDVRINLSSNKIIQSLHQRLELEAQYTTIRQLTKFYEKQTEIVQNQLNQKLRDSEVYLSNKVNTIRLLRIENHSFQAKLRGLDDKIEQLNDVLKGGGGAKAKKKQIEALQVSPLNPRKKSNKQDAARPSGQAQLIEQFMTTNNWKNDIEDKIEEYKNNKIQIENKIDMNNEQIFDQEKELTARKKTFKDLQRSKHLFLYELLKIGKDSRQEGITWIVMHLWQEGEKVEQQHLPTFLDQKAKDFILTKSEKMMELKELVSLQDMQMDVYKQNIHNSIQSQKQSKLQTSFYDSKTHFSVSGQNNMQLDILDYQTSILQEQQKEQNQGKHKQTVNSINSIIGQSKQQIPQNLSFINVSQIRSKKTDERKASKIINLNQMLRGLNNNELSVVNQTIDQLQQPKITSNDIFYEETIKKMRENFRVQKTIIPPKIKKEEDNISDFEDSFEEESQIEENLEESEENKPEMMENNILLYENDAQMNKYQTKQEFFKEQRNLSYKIGEKERELRGLEDEEMQRIIKEFDYKNYISKYKTKYSIVLCSLFGAFKAEREIVRNGLKEKKKK